MNNEQIKQLLLSGNFDNIDLNQFRDIEVKGIKVRFQKVYDYPPSLLRNLIDQGKKDIVSGLIISYAIEHNNNKTTNILIYLWNE